MSYPGDYHVHLERGPYVMDWLCEFIEAAKKADVAEVGFAEHAYRFRQTDAIWPKEWPLKPETDADEYVSLIEEAKKAGLPVKLGVEVDFVPGKETRISDFLEDYPWDYVIGSVHFIGDWGFDRPDEAYLWKSANVETAYKKYFELFRAAAETQLFHIMAHPDVIKVFGYKPPGSLIKEYERSAASMAKAGVAFEISTAGLRKPVGEYYPSPEFLDACVNAGLATVISSDAHKPSDVGRDFREAYQYARSHGVIRVAVFAQGNIIQSNDII
ncbi:MAG TPA: histidinol-phosphatase [Firmicutes bacterium]|nr:histidinol-phosphatase [Bacillota bacterium]